VDVILFEELRETMKTLSQERPISGTSRMRRRNAEDKKATCDD
jgi:hypothetical protein